MDRMYRMLPLFYFVLATVLLMVIALLLMLNAAWDLVTSFGAPDRIDTALNSIGLLIIGFAVIETAKFIAEEEILRQRELRSPRESRRSITKFISIIVIAASLEALVMIFKTGLDAIPLAVYPAILFASAMFALIALGAYQYLSSRIESGPEQEVQSGD